MQTIPVPEQFLQECKAPVVNPETNAGLVQAVLDYHNALQSCNDDKAALRQFVKENK